MWSPEIKNRVVNFRKQGLTYSEIRKKVRGLSNGTLAGWCKEITLSALQESRIYQRAQTALERARILSARTLRKRRLVREQNVQRESSQEFVYRQNDTFFLLGIVLYWAEGTKGGSAFQFMNSDPRLIKFMYMWLIKACSIPKEEIKIRLYTHKLYASEQPEVYWKKVLSSLPASSFQKTVYKATPHKVKKNPNYKGCVRIQVGRVDLLRKIRYNCELVSRKFQLT